MDTLLLDTDPGSDDAVALALALASPAVDLVGATTVAGNTTVDNATRNALAVLSHLGGGDVPVARGCDRPLADELSTIEHIHGPGGLHGEIPDADADPVDEHAVEFMIDRAREHGGDLTIAAVGPLTNLAAALAVEPALPELVGEIRVMGGAAFVGGNATPAAEFNFYTDPVAASRVVRDARPTLAGLDVTNRATFPPGTVADLAERNPRLRAVASWIGYTEDPSSDGRDESPPAHDALVVADLLGDVLDYGEYRLEVDTSGGPSHGNLLAHDPDGAGGEPTATVATGVDVERFRELVLDALRRIE